jgi:hypothetical protein
MRQNEAHTNTALSKKQQELRQNEAGGTDEVQQKRNNSNEVLDEAVKEMHCLLSYSIVR